MRKANCEDSTKGGKGTGTRPSAYVTSHQISLRADTTGSPKHSQSHTSSIAKITPSSLPTASSSFLHWSDLAGVLSTTSSAITHGSPYRQRVRCYLRATVIRTRSWIHCQRRGRGAVDVVGLGEFSFGDGDRVGHEGGSGITNRWMSKRGSDSVLEIDAVVFNFLWRYLDVFLSLQVYNWMGNNDCERVRLHLFWRCDCHSLASGNDMAIF